VSIHSRIREGRLKLRMTEEEFADAVGVSRSAVQQWEREDGTAPKRTNQPRVAALLGITVAELMGGMEQLREIAKGNVGPGPDVRGQVPLISWVQAGNWNGAEDPLHPGDAEEWLACPAPHSVQTYALRVRGDSMTAPSGNARSYPEGSIIFVDPRKRSPVNGQRIIAKLTGTDEVTFKVFKNEDGRFWLQPLNPMHEPIKDEFTVLGTVIGKWEPEW
jgi:SOS-response transcriptional repressor LexA